MHRSTHVSVLFGVCNFFSLINLVLVLGLWVTENLSSISALPIPSQGTSHSHSATPKLHFLLGTKCSYVFFQNCCEDWDEVWGLPVRELGTQDRVNKCKMSNSATDSKVCCEADVSPRSVADRCWDSVNVDTLLPWDGNVKETDKGSWSICSEYEALWGIRCLQQCHLAQYGRRGRTLAVPTETSLSGPLSVPHPYPTQAGLGRRSSSCSIKFSANLLWLSANIMHLFCVHIWEGSFLSFLLSLF